MKRTVGLIAAIIIALLLITGIVVAIIHAVTPDAKKSANNGDSSMTSNVPSTDGSNTPDASTQNQPNGSQSQSSTQPAQSGTNATGSSTTTPSTGPSDVIVILGTAAALGAAAYVGSRATASLRR